MPRTDWTEETIGDWLMSEGDFAPKLLLLNRCDYDKSMYEIALEFDAAGKSRQPLPAYDDTAIMRPDLDGLVHQQHGHPVVQWMPPEYRTEAGAEQGRLYLVDDATPDVRNKWEQALASNASDK